MNHERNLRWRVAAAADLRDVQEIADAIHVDLPERPELFMEKLKLFPEGCFVLLQNETMVGYAFSYPWLLKDVPPLNQHLVELPDAPDCLFIHDVAIQPHARGYGAAAVLVERMTGLARARHIQFLALVSVYDTHRLWAHFGFQLIADPALADHLKTYGNPAHYMIRPLD